MIPLLTFKFFLDSISLEMECQGLAWARSDCLVKRIAASLSIIPILDAKRLPSMADNDRLPEPALCPKLVYREVAFGLEALDASLSPTIRKSGKKTYCGLTICPGTLQQHLADTCRDTKITVNLEG